MTTIRARLTTLVFLSLFLLLTPLTASALTVKDWLATSDADQRSFVADSIETLVTSIAKTDSNKAQQVHDWFIQKQAGKPFSEGLEKLYVEIGALQELAGEGKIDLSAIKVEGVIIKVVKDKFASQK